MNGGTLFVMPCLLANATCGFTAGLVPPIDGCEWQPPQLSRFIVGPRPSSTSSASSKSSLPALNAASCGGVRLRSGRPALSLPARGPGSRALDGRIVSALDVLSVALRSNAATVSRTALAVSAAGFAAVPLPALVGVASLAAAGVSLSDPPLQAIRPAPATKAKIKGLMWAPPLKPLGSANLRFASWLQARNRLCS